MPNFGKKKRGTSSSKKSNKSPGGPEFGRSEIDDQMAIAAFKGDVEEVKKCIAEGADVNCPNALGNKMFFLFNETNIRF